jgi:hypothetical protein
MVLQATNSYRYIRLFVPVHIQDELVEFREVCRCWGGLSELFQSSLSYYFSVDIPESLFEVPSEPGIAGEDVSCDSRPFIWLFFIIFLDIWFKPIPCLPSKMSGHKDDLVSLTRQLSFVGIEVHVHLSKEPSEFGLSSIKWFSLGQLGSRDATN